MTFAAGLQLSWSPFKEFQQWQWNKSLSPDSAWSLVTCCYTAICCCRLCWRRGLGGWARFRPSPLSWCVFKGIKNKVHLGAESWELFHWRRPVHYSFELSQKTWIAFLISHNTWVSISLMSLFKLPLSHQYFWKQKGDSSELNWRSSYYLFCQVQMTFKIPNYQRLVIEVLHGSWQWLRGHWWVLPSACGWNLRQRCKARKSCLTFWSVYILDKSENLTFSPEWKGRKHHGLSAQWYWEAAQGTFW